VFKAGNKKSQADASHFAPHSGELVSSTGKKKNWLPFIGGMLVVAGLIFFAATSGMAAAQWLLGLWPLFAIIAGVAGVMGFAVERKPKSPVSGMLLIFVGVLFSAGRFHPNLNALQIYGRYWILLLFVFAGVELIRHYSHRQNDGKPPRLFSFGKLLMVTLIVGSGVLANRIAVNNPSLLSSLKLPGFLSTLRDSVIGEKYTFTDEAITISTIRPNSVLTVQNSYGNVKVVGGAPVLRAYLVKDVAAWKREDASEISEKIKLLTSQAPDGSYTITTNRDEVNDEIKHEFNTHIQIEVPSSVGLSITNSYGTVTTNQIQGDVIIKSSFGRAEANAVAGNAIFHLKNSEIVASAINGNVTVTGAKKVKMYNIAGAVKVEANRGSVDVSDVSGIVTIDASQSRIILQNLQESATIKTSHENVKVTNAASVTITAPYSEVSAINIRGDLRIESSNKDIRATSISGNLTIQAELADVRAEDVQGVVKIETSHGEVSVKNFHQGVDVETSYKDVVLTVAEQVAGDINVENNRGEIKVVLPQTSSFHIDAESEGGRVKTKGFNDMEQTDRDSLHAVQGSDGPTIRLRTDRDIHVQASGLRQAQTKGGVKPPATSSKD
jgi:uncharacterized membrane protein HdeD (DUF308 family)